MAARSYTATRPESIPSFRRIDAAKVADTAAALARRIAERFPGSGLSGLARELHAIASDAAARAAALGRPDWGLRVAACALGAALVAVVVVAVAGVGLPSRVGTFQELVQMLESGINDAVFVGIAIFFLASLENRRKRRRALDLIEELRSLAHIVDMHQLTKDPDRFHEDFAPTPASPPAELTRAQLARYLDYCTELLAITSKVAALYAQELADPVVLAAVDEIENLTSGLSRKIWQKIMILDAIDWGGPPPAGSETRGRRLAG
jgi:hypothetical protein